MNWSSGWNGALAMLGVGWLALGVVLGQEAAPDKVEDEAPRWLRLLPVGDAPPFRHEVVDGMMVELPPPPGSIPPRRVRVGALDSEEQPVLLKLGLLSPRLVVRGVKAPVLSAAPGTPVRPWKNLELPPEATSALAVLIRGPQDKSWESPLAIVLDDGLEAFPNGAARVVNASPYPLRVVLGTERHTIDPAKTRIMQLPAGRDLDNVPLVLEVAAGGGSWTRVYDSALTQNRNERTNVVVYRSDGVKKRRPAKVLVVRDRSTIPPLPAAGKDGSEGPEGS